MIQSVWSKLHNSLLIRLGGIIVAISLMALVGMTASWMIAETTQGNGEAINIAGSLRMQSWRMVSHYQAYLQNPDTKNKEQLSMALRQFEQSLESPIILEVVSGYQQAPVHASYQQVQRDWTQHIKPVLLQPESYSPVLLLERTPEFVGTINTLVKNIEQTTEAKILILRVVLAVAIIITLLIVILSMYIIYTSLIQPLSKLLQLTDKMRRGDLSVRTRFTDDDEIGRLGRSFDLMSEDLRLFYQELEARVEQKTAELTRSNRSLDLLYRLTSRLNTLSAGQQPFKEVLEETEALLGLGHSFICLNQGDTAFSGKNPIAISTNSALQLKSCGEQSCQQCNKRSTVSLTQMPEGIHNMQLPLVAGDKHLGILMVAVPAGKKLDQWQIQLLETIARHLGVAISEKNRIEQQRRVALLEERAVIARELHDSLAQSLAYMRIQVTRLGNSMEVIDNESQRHEIMEELREGLNSSYVQLRELLSTFRLKMEEESLYIALQNTVDEFMARGEVNIELHIDLAETNLSPSEEIHLLHISREALSNVLKHAQAGHAWVRLLNTNQTTVIMQIEDDGIGISRTASQHHYGMSIMEERAGALRAEIMYKERPQGGTIVELAFTPYHLRNTHIIHQQDTPHGNNTALIGH